MGTWKRTRDILVLLLPLCLALSSLAQGNEGTVKLLQSNSYMTNSSLVHPGGPVILANGSDTPKEEPPKAVIEEKPKEIPKEPEIKKVEPPPIEMKTEEKAEIKAVEEKPKGEVKKNNYSLDLRSAGFFSDIDYRGIGIVVESKEGKNLMGEGDIAYLSFSKSESVSIGNKYTVFRASELVNHPISGKKIGRRFNIIGNIQIIDRYGRFYVAKIIEVFDGLSKGDFIRPYFKQIMEVEQGTK